MARAKKTSKAPVKRRRRRAVPVLAQLGSGRFPEYSGLTYEAASREAQRLIDQRGWFQSFERLSALRKIMQRAS